MIGNELMGVRIRQWATLGLGLLTCMSAPAASAALFSDLDAEFDLVRPGLCIYGLAPAGAGVTPFASR